MPPHAPRVLPPAPLGPSDLPDSNPTPDASVAQAADLLRGKRFAVLTGAGLSTDSGIPDYRGPDSSPRSPMTYQQFIGSDEFRRHYWARNHVGWRHMAATNPNAGHYAVVDLENAGVLAGLITQNVDTLHQKAGSRHMIDLHGSYDRVICLTCKNIVSRESLDARLTELNPNFRAELGDIDDIEIAPDADAVIETTAHFRIADCEICGGLLKPDIVYFGETVPKPRVDAAYAMVDDGDALLVAGSSLTVHSGLRFARYANKHGKPLVIINTGPTRADNLADLKLDAGTTPSLVELNKRLSQQ